MLFGDREDLSAAARAMAEITEYALAGCATLIYQLVASAIDDAKKGKPAIIENSVWLYLQLWLEEFVANEIANGNVSGLPVDLYQPLLADDVRNRLSIDHAQFVEAAFKRRDYKAVIDAVPRC